MWRSDDRKVIKDFNVTLTHTPKTKQPRNHEIPYRVQTWDAIIGVCRKGKDSTFEVRGHGMAVCDTGVLDKHTVRLEKPEDRLWRRLDSISKRIASMVKEQERQTFLRKNDEELEKARYAAVDAFDKVLEEIESKMKTERH